jgi:hypothetical protein
MASVAFRRIPPEQIGQVVSPLSPAGHRKVEEQRRRFLITQAPAVGAADLELRCAQKIEVETVGCPYQSFSPPAAAVARLLAEEICQAYPNHERRFDSV